MDIGIIFSNIGVTLTLILGSVAIISPDRIQSFVNIRAIGKEGVSEVRATYGGLFSGIAIYALLAQSQDVFLTIGIGWLAASLVRFTTLFFGSVSSKNIGGVVFEGAIGICCSASAFT
jgi:hypothetical protein